AADVQRSPPALIVRRDRDELEDAFDVELLEPGLSKPVGGAGADEALRAGTCVDPGSLHADETMDGVLGRSGETDERDHLLGRQLCNRRLALERVAGDDPDLRPSGALSL